jgi:RHS repeat-associated protein
MWCIKSGNGNDDIRGEGGLGPSREADGEEKGRKQVMKSNRMFLIVAFVHALCLAAWGQNGNNPCTPTNSQPWFGNCFVTNANCEWVCAAPDTNWVCCITYNSLGNPESCEIKKVEECCVSCGGNTCTPGSATKGLLPGASWTNGSTAKSMSGVTVNGRIQAIWNMGKDVRGRPSGQIRLTGELGGAGSMAQTAALAIDKLGNSLSLVVDGNGLLRAVAPQAVAEVQNRTSWGYELAFYHREDTGTNGVPLAGAEPFVRWRVEDPDSGTAGNARLWLSEITGSQTSRWEYMQTATNLVLRDSAGLREEEMTGVGTSSGVWQQLLIRNGTTGAVAERRVYTHENYDFGQKLVKEEVGAEGSEVLVKEIQYYADEAQVGSYGQRSLETYGDGSWVRYEYDLHGRVTKEVRPWLDGDETSSESNSVVVSYDYTCLDDRETPRMADPSWRKMEKRIAGTWVATDYRVFFKDASGDDVEIVESAADATAGYGASGNRQTQKWLHGDQDGEYRAHKPRVHIQADGRVTSYTYVQGEYAEGGENIGVFTPSTNGAFVQIAETPDSLGLVPYKSVRSVSVVDEWGKEFQSETWVCTGIDQWAQMDWQTVSRDEFGRELVRRYANGLTSETTWSCCGKESETKPDGQSWSYVQDMLGRTTHSIQEDGPTEAIVYDAAGKVLSKTLSGGGLSLATSNRYDLAGRLVESWDEAGLSTTIEYGERTETVTRPGGATETTTRFRDGNVKSIMGSGVVPAYYEYGMEANGGQWTKTYTGSTNSSAWNLVVRDREGRTVRTEQPGFGGTVVTNTYEYDDEGQLVREGKTGSLDNLNVYDERGDLFRSGTDVTTNGVLDLGSMDRIREQRSEYIQSGSNWFHQQTAIIYPFDNSTVPFTNSISRKQVGGRGCACESGGEEAVDARGNVSTSQTSVDPLAKTVTKTLNRAGIADAETTVASNGLLRSRTLPTGAEYLYLYDGLGRQVGVVDPRTGTNSTVYLANGRVDYVEDAAGYRTTYGYDATTGRRISVTDALANIVHTAYDVQGRVTNTWGATYPVAYEYDAYGRMSAMKTWRDTNGAPDVTRWNYDEATGLLTNKVYADNLGPSYEYDGSGRLAKRIWARGVTNTYAYDALGQLTGIDYPDGTPDVAFTYDRLGRQTAVTDGTGTRGFAYDSFLQLQEETNWLANIERTYDGYGRPQTVDLGEFEVGYDYDANGRFASVTSTVAGIYTHQTQHRYAYLADSSLLALVSNGSLVATFSYEPHRDLKTNIEHHWGTNPVSSFAYAYDTAGRRTVRVDSELTTNVFGYNLRSELVAALLGTNAYGYAYDPIGNRIAATNNGAATAYAANELNQYTNVAPAPGALAYDLDGNLVSDGARAYSWDAENRLIGVAPVATNAGSVRLNCAYDYMSRRVWKEVEAWDGSAWTNVLTALYAYDGWNLVCEDRSDDPRNNYYVWGLDLSGTSQGAGGVGGLLARVREENIPHPLYYAGDANGNVTDLVDANGAVVAHYEYDPYGNNVAQSGDQADANPYRFSSKYWDGETGFYYYGHRFYSSNLGRWLNRDPIEERGGINLYGFIGNQPTTKIDALGNEAYRFWPQPGKGVFIGPEFHREALFTCLGSLCKVRMDKAIDASIEQSLGPGDLLPGLVYKPGVFHNDRVGAMLKMKWIVDDDAPCKCCVKMRFQQTASSVRWGFTSGGNEQVQWNAWVDYPTISGQALGYPASFNGTIDVKCLTSGGQLYDAASYSWSINFSPHPVTPSDLAGGWDIKVNWP